MIRPRLRVTLAAFLILIIAATVGYHLLMDWSLLQSLFFTVITLTTIGYSDYQLNESSKALTIGVVIIGLALWYLLLATLVEIAALGWQAWGERRLMRDLEKLHDHFIVVGYGQVGQKVADWLRRSSRRALIVDVDPEVCERARADGYLAYEGDATEEETLARAGLQRSAGILAVTRNDPVNVFVTLTARGMRPDLYIAAAGISPGVDDKLRRAGATVVISPYEISAQRLAQGAISPHVAEMLHTLGDESQAGLMLREAVVEQGSPVCDKPLRDSGLREGSGVPVVAIRRAGGDETLGKPEPHEVLHAGDILIAFGTCAQLNRFFEMVSPEAARELRVLG